MAEARRHPAVVQVDDLEWSEERSPDGRSVLRRKRLAAAVGGEKLGCTLFELPPGKRSWPRHAHLANEEAIYVLAGRGVVVIGDRQVPVEAGDYVAHLPGVERAHQMRNDSDELLVYLCFSTMIEPDISIYPDSGKVGLAAGAAPGGPPPSSTLKTFLRLDAVVDYWQGEGGD